MIFILGQMIDDPAWTAVKMMNVDILGKERMFISTYDIKLLSQSQLELQLDFVGYEFKNSATYLTNNKSLTHLNLTFHSLT